VEVFCLSVRKASLIFSIVILADCIVFIVCERAALSGLQQENTQLHERLTDLDLAHQESAELLRKQIDDNQRMRSNENELVRLRAEVTRLRTQLKESEAAKVLAVASRTNTVVTSPAETNSALSVEEYVANARAQLAWNQTLVTGGWTISGGKRCLIFVEPRSVENSGDELTLQAKFMEIPDELLTQIGLSNLASDKSESSSQTILTAEQMVAVGAILKDSAGTDILSFPEITTRTGRQTQMKAVDTHKTAAGEEYETGPSIDISPQISSGGESVNLTVSVLVNLRPR